MTTHRTPAQTDAELDAAVDAILARWRAAYPTVYPTPTVDEPDIDDLEEMIAEGICETTDGCYAEPDGFCEHNHPSWLLYYGLI